MERAEYLQIVTKFKKEKRIDRDFLHSYYLKKGGMIKDPDQFLQILGQWGTSKAVSSVFEDLNVKFNVIILTQGDKFIQVL